MENEKYRNSIINAYHNLVSNTMADISNIEKIIIECPDIGTVRDGGKAIYANECRRLIALLLNEYYFTENLDKWNEFKELLKSRIENELNYEKKGVTTEMVSKNWATNAVLKDMEYAESELCTDMNKKYSELNNTEIRNIDFENCPSKCVSCKEDCECMAVGKCREHLTKKLDKIK